MADKIEKEKKPNVIQRYFRETVGELRKVKLAYHERSMASDQNCIDGFGRDEYHPGHTGFCVLEADRMDCCIGPYRHSAGERSALHGSARFRKSRTADGIRKPGEEVTHSDAPSAPLSMDAPAAPDTAIDQSIEQAGDKRAWYVVHCYSGYENKVRHNLEQRIETMGMKDRIFDVVIPTQEEIEVKDGKRKTVERHVFPGYVLVNMILSEESWYVVRNTPGVTGLWEWVTTPTPLAP